MKLDSTQWWSPISYKSILKLSMDLSSKWNHFSFEELQKTGKVGGGHLLFPKINGERFGFMS